MLHIAADENPVSVSNLDETRASNRTIGTLAGNNARGTTQFTTGAHASNYELVSVTIQIDSSYPVVGTPGDLVVAIYSNGSNDFPNAEVIRLSGTNPTGAGEHTYTCTSNCTLTKDTKYHVHLEAPNATGTNSNYAVQNTNSGSETLKPSGNGWSLGNSYRFTVTGNQWVAIPDFIKVKVTAMPK